MSSYEAMEIIKNTYIDKFNRVAERIKEGDYDNLTELSKLSGKAEAYREVICSILTAKELTLYEG